MTEAVYITADQAGGELPLCSQRHIIHTSGGNPHSFASRDCHTRVFAKHATRTEARCRALQTLHK
eukprot:1161045-Pelagomonas_calceolata.AAC.17